MSKSKPTKINVYLAADAFLYLPIYLAKKIGVFEAENLDVTIQPEEFKKLKGGDGEAINAMLCDEGLAFSISSASPLMSKHTENKFTDCSVIASLINKLPFWALNHEDKVYESEAELANFYKNIIHLSNDFKEAFYLGQMVKNKNKRLETIEAKGFGSEIEELKRNNDKTFTISAALDKIALELNASNDLSINYRFSQGNTGSRFLTTAIITKKNLSSYHRKASVKFLKSIQKAILIIYSAPMATKYYISSKGEIFNYANSNFGLKSKETESVVKIIREEELYPRDLNICLKSWTQSMKALEFSELRYQENYDPLRTKFKIRRAYFNYIDNSIVHQAERELALEIGINNKTFSSFIDSSLVRKFSMYYDFFKIPFRLDFKFPLFLIILLIIISIIFKFPQLLIGLIPCFTWIYSIYNKYQKSHAH